MTATLASMTRYMTLIGEREAPETFPAANREHLVTATALINQFLGTDPAGGSQVLKFDTYRRRRQTVGLALPVGDKEPFPYFDLPSTGPLGGLQVRYRGDGDADYADPAFSWDDIQPLTEREHFIYDPSAGRIRLLFYPSDLPEGIEVRYGNAAGIALPDIAVGDVLRTMQSKLVMEVLPDGAVLPEMARRMFGGVDYKAAADSAMLSGMTSLRIMSPDGAARIESIRLFAPRNVPMSETPIRLSISVGGSIYVVLGDDNRPRPADVYACVLPPPGGTDATLTVTAPDDLPAALTVSRLRLGLYHPTWTHMDGIVSATISQACAQLADFLRKRVVLDGTGKTNDKTRRNYTGVTSIPSEIRDMLESSRRTRSGVTFI